jgi:hypothetical protein
LGLPENEADAFWWGFAVCRARHLVSKILFQIPSQEQQRTFLARLPAEEAEAFVSSQSGQGKPFLSLLEKEAREAFLWGACFCAYQQKHSEVTQATAYLEDLKNRHDTHDYLPSIRGVLTFLVGGDTDYPRADFVGLADAQTNAFAWGQRFCYMMLHDGDFKPAIGLTRGCRNAFILGCLYSCYTTIGIQTPTWDGLAQFVVEYGVIAAVQAATMFKQLGF